MVIRVVYSPDPFNFNFLKLLEYLFWLQLFFFKDFINLFDREVESTGGQSGRRRQREKQALRWAGSPMLGLILDPRIMN